MINWSPLLPDKLIGVFVIAPRFAYIFCFGDYNPLLWFLIIHIVDSMIMNMVDILYILKLIWMVLIT